MDTSSDKLVKLRTRRSGHDLKMKTSRELQNLF